MVIKFYVVSMYRNLNIDIVNVAKILPAEERFPVFCTDINYDISYKLYDITRLKSFIKEMVHLINGYANYQTAIIHENKKGMSDPDLTKDRI